MAKLHPLDRIRTAVTRAVAEALAGRCEAAEGTAIVAACSGGADSVALVAALTENRDRWPLVGVVFVDHGLREVAAELGAATEAAARAGLPLLTRVVDLSGKGSVQQAARDARYQALRETALGFGPDVLIATGHTEDDQAETVLQRLTRGAGLAGLAGIPWRSAGLVRPLLAVSRQQTRAMGLPFSDDPTNATQAYLRNRLRHTVVPLLVAENPGAVSALASTANHIQDELALVSALVSQISLEDIHYMGLPVGVAETLIRWRQRDAPDRVSPSRAAVQQLAKLLVEGGRSRRVSLGGGTVGYSDEGKLAFGKERDSRREVVAACPGTYRLGTLRVILLLDPPQLVGEGPKTEVLTVSTRAPIQWPLTLRRRTGRELRAGRPHGQAQTEPSPRTPDGIHRPIDEFMITDGAGTVCPFVRQRATIQPFSALLVRLVHGDTGLLPTPEIG